MNRTNVCRVAVMVLSVLMLTPSLSGCARKKKKVVEEGPTENPLKIDPGAAPAQGAVRRGAQRQVNQQLFRNIGQYYALYRTENGRGPQNLQEFLTYLKSDPNARAAKVPQALEGGWVVMVFPPNPTSNTVLAYEKEMFQLHHNRLVLFGDGNSVKMMTEPQFQAALKAQ